MAGENGVRSWCASPPRFDWEWPPPESGGGVEFLQPPGRAQWDGAGASTLERQKVDAATSAPSLSFFE